MKTLGNIGSAIALFAAMFSPTYAIGLPTPPGSPSIESRCGATDDYQDVERYDGTLGPSVNFVRSYQSAVGQIQWNNNLATIYTNPGNVSGARWCTGTLVGKTTFITAGHCFDVQANDGVDWDFPLDNSTGREITPQQAARNMHINFNYQRDTNGTLRTEVEFPVLSLREFRLGGLDYAVLQLGENSKLEFPGDVFGITTVMSNIPNIGELTTIIQHPNGIPKVVEAGTYIGEDAVGRMLYANLDTEGGSSGSGVLVPNGLLVAIHTNAGCNATGGANRGFFIADIAAVSAEVRLLAMSSVRNLWKPAQAINVETGTAASTVIGDGAWSAHWSFEKVGNFYRIRNRWTGGYLHMENGRLEYGSVKGSWHSAMWRLASGTLDGKTYYRIENRWKPKHFLHIENGKLETGDVPTSYHSSWWAISNI